MVGPKPVDLNLGWRLKFELEAAGFSSRTANALAYSGTIESVAQLRVADWGDPAEGNGLGWTLLRVPGVGPRGLAEVNAFRAGASPREAEKYVVPRLSVAIDSQTLAALDLWRHTQADKPSRSEAARRVLSGTLASRLAGSGTGA